MSGAGFTLDPTALQPADFARQASQLPPRGDCWPRSPLSFLQALIGGLADTTSYVHALAVEFLVTESDPATTLQLLPDFERVYGLPDPCTPINPTIEQRRVALLARIAAQGGCDQGYFVAVAASLGVVVQVGRVLPFWAGQGVAGGLLYGPRAVGEWTIHVVSGDASSVAQMKCIFARIEPAQAAIYYS